MGFSGCGVWPLWLQVASSVAPRHVRSSWTRALNPCPLHWQVNSLPLDCLGGLCRLFNGVRWYLIYFNLHFSGQGGLACCDSWGHKESDTTEQLSWTEPLAVLSIFSCVCWPVCLLWRNVCLGHLPIFWWGWLLFFQFFSISSCTWSSLLCTGAALWLQRTGFSLRWPLVSERGPRMHGLSHPITCEIFRDSAHVPCIGRQDS